MDEKKPTLSSMTDAEFDIAASRVREMLGSEIVKYAESQGFDVGDMLRITVLTEQLKRARENHGLTIKEAATELNVAQYRLRDIESGSKRMQPVLAERYFEFLGLKSAAVQWANDFPDLAEKLGLELVK